MNISWPRRLPLLIIILHSFLIASPPKLAVILIVDQFSYGQMRRLKPHFRHGFKTLLEKGINYTNAYFPHANPGTAIGHTCLSTGAYAKDHGIVSNHWYTADGTREIRCDDDSAKAAAVFHRNGAALHNYGKSAANIMVDGLSDQFAIESQPAAPQHAIALSYKSRSAISTAGKLGKAIWYDENEDQFTSSTAYFKQLPRWITAFNKSGIISRFKEASWNPLYPLTSPAYAMHNPCTYDLCSRSRSPMNHGVKQKVVKNVDDDDDEYEDDTGSKNPFLTTPAANQLLLNLAHACIEEHLNARRPDRLLLWVSLSCLDKLGHGFGPESIETIDMLYHLDQQLGSFINQIQSRHGKEVLFALTADHGVAPLVELVDARGYGGAKRTDPDQLITQLNNEIYHRYSVANIITNFSRPSFYLDIPRLRAQPEHKQTKIINTLKQMLTEIPTIKRAWTYADLDNEHLASDEIANYFKQQLFPGRSGLLTIQPFPYTVLKHKINRATHNTPYCHDIHVPLTIYQAKGLKPQTFDKQVSMLRFAPTMAHLINTQRPSASTAPLLPGIAAESAPATSRIKKWFGSIGRGSRIKTAHHTRPLWARNAFWFESRPRKSRTNTDGSAVAPRPSRVEINRLPTAGSRKPARLISAKRSRAITSDQA